MNKRIKILYRRNLKLSEGKLAAQCVHAALGIKDQIKTETNDFKVMELKRIDRFTSVVVLPVSDKKFEEFKIAEAYNFSYLQRDHGYTEVPAGTETCFAFLEDDPRS